MMTRTGTQRSDQDGARFVGRSSMGSRRTTLGELTHAHTETTHEDSYDTSPAVTRAGDGSDAAEHPLSRGEIGEGPDV